MSKRDAIRRAIIMNGGEVSAISTTRQSAVAVFWMPEGTTPATRSDFDETAIGQALNALDSRRFYLESARLIDAERGTGRYWKVVWKYGRAA